MPTHMISEKEWRDFVASRDQTRTAEQTKVIKDGTCPECIGCEHLRSGGGCSCYTHCVRWLKWFGQEWGKIQEAAEQLKKERKKDSDD